MNTIKKFCVGLILALVLSLLIVQAPSAVSAELSYQEKAVDFLEDVVGLDLAKYEVELKYYNDYSSDSNSLYDVDATYNLKSEGSQLTAKFFLKNNAKFICQLRGLKGSMLLTQSAPNVLESVKGFMERYQNFAGASYVEPLREMLHNVTELKNMTVTVDDLRFTVEPSPVGEDFVTFQLMYMPNGIYNRFTQIGVMFNKGVLDRFADNWNSCLVGSSEVNVSEEQAIDIAKEHIQTYSYMFGNRTIGNLTVKDDIQPVASLSMHIRTANLLYPLWELLVPLAKVYPGFVTAMHVYLWADTGELAFIEKSGVGGGGVVPESFETSDDATPKPTQMEDNPASSMAPFAIVAVVISSSIIATVTAIILRKRRKR